jgi:hypothetical protein
MRHPRASTVILAVGQAAILPAIEREATGKMLAAASMEACAPAR